MKISTLPLHIVLLIFMMITLVTYVFFTTERFKVGDVWSQDTDLVIVSSHYNENIQWLRESTVEPPVVICSKTLTYNLDCRTIPNKGREVTSYLRFIIDNYHRLPRHIAFIHGHEKAWHQLGRHDLIDIITRCAKYKEYGYVSLNNNLINDRNIASNEHMKLMHERWDEWFRPFLHRDPPAVVLHDCCAQFIVKRERIWRLPLTAYKRWYDLMMVERSPMDVKMGYVFEFIWHIIFGEPDIITQEEYDLTMDESC